MRIYAAARWGPGKPNGIDGKGWLVPNRYTAGNRSNQRYRIAGALGTTRSRPGGSKEVGVKIRNWALSLLAMTVAWLGGALATSANAGPALGLAKPMADNAIIHKVHRRRYRRHRHRYRRRWRRRRYRPRFYFYVGPSYYRPYYYSPYYYRPYYSRRHRYRRYRYRRYRRHYYRRHYRRRHIRFYF